MYNNFDFYVGWGIDTSKYVVNLNFFSKLIE